jgi:deoxycytidine triphosphate deaminase
MTQYRSYKDKFPALPSVDERDFWIDPDNSTAGGLLLSDRIEFYCRKVNLIYPYHRDFLRPASYTLHAGREYLVTDRAGEVSHGILQEGGKVKIPPSGLIYIRFFEQVNIPHYLIARFNLRVTQVYRGLLLGTGPQVDPGFKGLLGCPIHNFTDSEKIIEFFDDLITIDFEKTTPFPDSAIKARHGIDPFKAYKEAGGKGVDDIEHIIFPANPGKEFKNYLPPGESVKSSLFAMQEKVDKFGGRLDVYRRFAVIGLLGVLFAGAQLAFDAYREIKDDMTKLHESLERIDGKVNLSLKSGVEENQRDTKNIYLRHEKIQGRKTTDDTKSRLDSNQPVNHKK